MFLFNKRLVLLFLGISGCFLANTVFGFSTKSAFHKGVGKKKSDSAATVVTASENDVINGRSKHIFLATPFITKEHHGSQTEAPPSSQSDSIVYVISTQSTGSKVNSEKPQLTGHTVSYQSITRNMVKKEQNYISTPFAQLWSSIASSSMLTFFTELGDRTFFIAAILSLRFPKKLVFFSTCAALVIQTVFSTGAGRILHNLPEKATKIPFFSLPIDDYAAAVLLFVFGCLHLRAAICDDENDNNISRSTNISQTKPPPKTFVMQNNEHGKDSIPLTTESAVLQAAADTLYAKLREGRKPSEGTETVSGESLTMCDSSMSFMSTPLLSGNQSLAIECNNDIINNFSLSRHQHKNDELLEAERTVRRMQIHNDAYCLAPSSISVFRHIFWIIFVAELGDKSMISTVALATAQNPYGVFIGSATAHCFVTLIAVAAGSVLDGYISARAANFIGGFLFLTFSAMTTLEGLARQGIKMWWFIGEKASALFLAYFVTTGKDLTLGSHSLFESSLRVPGVFY